MPTYEYECKACDHKFEKFQSITANPIKKCPVCKANRVKRLIGMGAGIIFKGSGFYQTDYRDSAYNEAAKKDKEPTTSCGSSDVCKSCEHAPDADRNTTGDKIPSGDSSKAETTPTDTKADTKTADTVTASSQKKNFRQLRNN